MAKKNKKKTKKPVFSKKIKPADFKSEDKNELESIRRTKIRVIGIGGGGGNIVSGIASRISKASFVAANTDVKSLKSCGRKVVKFQFGQSLTQGLGTGMNYELGKLAAQSEKEKIKKLCQGQDLCILVASLGGGTGSGAVSTFAKISKDLGNLTYGIFTLPFSFEGEKKMEIALSSLKEAKSHLNAVTIIPNERVFRIINKDTPLKEALSAINKFLSESLEGLIEVIYEPGLINIDFADFKTILEGRGRLAYLNMIESPRKEGDIKEVAAKVFTSPLYPYTIRGAKSVLFNISGEKNLSLIEVSQISKTISELVSSSAKIIFGISQKTKQPNIIKTILLATGCGMKISPPAKISAKIKKETSSSLPANPSQKAKEKKKPEKRKKPVLVSKRTEAIADKAQEKEVSSSPKKSEAKEEGQKKDLLKKIKVKTAKESKEKKAEKPEVKSSGPAKEEESEEINEKEKLRKNGLQIKKEAEEFEKQMLEKEKIWEAPAFLRKKTNNN